MDRIALIAGGKLDAADQFETGGGGERNCLVIALKRIVIGDGKSTEACTHRLCHQFFGSEGAV